MKLTHTTHIYFITSILLTVDASIAKPISVLLLNNAAPGHLWPLIGLGEELVKRGHNVTLCSTVMKGSTLLPSLPESVGINFVSAGDDYLTWNKFVQIMKVIQQRQELLEELYQATAIALINIHKKIESLGLDQFDIIVCDSIVGPACIYFAEDNKKAIMFNPFLPQFPAVNPGWRYPLTTFGGQFRDIGFIGRLFAIIATPISAVWSASLLGGRIVRKDDKFAQVLSNIDILQYPGIYIPHIITSVIGIETPTILTPLRHYVGPVLRGTRVPLDKDLSNWLDSKQNRSVLYISMGSTSGAMSRSRAEVIASAVLDTEFNAVWALKNGSMGALDSVDIDLQRLLVKDWAPQQVLTLLQHRAIKACIVHCGLNGVQASLYNSLPVICLPHFFDHFQIATAIEENKLGVSMYSFLDVLLKNTDFTRQDLSNAIEKVTSDEFVANAQKMSMIMKFAGGAKAAADLVEHYEDVGYNHLIPAFAKYQWTWIQYYNVDVYAVLLSVSALALLGCCACLRRCRGRKAKTD